jgi:hypothetical protein
MTVLVAGNVSGRPSVGGHEWALGHWALGVREAGHRTLFVDTGLREDLCHPDPVVGSGTELRQIEWIHPADAPQSELVIDVMGALQQRRPGRCPNARAVFLDIDPGYPQMWQALGLADLLSGYDAFATVGANVGRRGCTVPTVGRPWVAVAPPVFMPAWPMTTGGQSYTTVATWRNPYGKLAFRGETYGSRVHEFRKFMTLPRLVDVDFELALNIDAAERDDLRALEANGWRLVDPRTAAGSAADYRSYIQASRAEFSVVQNIYAATRSGWLSDRSACYLASGKPVITQDTGLRSRYPVGEGLLVFSTVEEAAAAIDAVESDYLAHSAAARALAEQHLDAKQVVSGLLEMLAALS